MNNKISCFINTFNSEKYLRECLLSVNWCDEIVVVDMYSEDKTLEILKDFNVKLFMHERTGYVEPARKFALEQCTHDWILNIDSDEIVPHALASEIKEIVDLNQYDLVKISRRNFFFGREILGSGWGYKDDLIHRFHKKGFLNFGDKIHAGTNIIGNPRVGYIIDKEKSIIHFNYDSVSQFIDKLNRYTDFEINSTKYNYKGNPLRKIVYHFFRELLGRFIYKKGYKDGWIGLYLALGMAFYRASAIAKANLPKEEDVIKSYQKYDYK